MKKIWSKVRWSRTDMDWKLTGWQGPEGVVSGTKLTVRPVPLVYPSGQCWARTTWHLQASWQHRGQWAQTETQEILPEHMERVCFLWGWLHTGTGFSERLWSHHPRTHPKVSWNCPWKIASRRTCLCRGLDKMISEVPSNITILWFCEI